MTSMKSSWPTRPGFSLPNDDPRHDWRPHRRLGAAFFDGAPVLGLIAFPIPGPGLEVTATTAISLAAVAHGIAGDIAGRVRPAGHGATDGQPGIRAAIANTISVCVLI